MSRRSTRLKNSLAGSGFDQNLGGAVLGAQCGACLLDVDTAGEDGEFVAVLDCCRPLHKFHIGCIFMWAEQENSCPQCKKRFATVAIYGINGELLRTSHAEERDQDFEAAEAQEEEDCRCQVCASSRNEEALLLCDGKGGRCNAAYHYYCVGLKAVPEDDWFCPPCARSRLDVVEALGEPPEEGAGSVEGHRAEGAAPSAPASPDASGSSGAQDPAAEPRRLQRGSDKGVAERVKCEPPESPLPLRARRRQGERVKEEKEEKEEGGEVKPRARGAEAGRAKEEVEPPSPAASGRFASLVAALTCSSPGAGRAGGTLQRRATPRQVGSPGSALSSPSTKSTSSRPGKPPEVEVKLEGEGFAGLCKGMPKWISRQGGVVRVDLGGRRMRDPAAVVVAKALTHRHD